MFQTAVNYRFLMVQDYVRPPSMYKVLAKYIKLVITELFSIHYMEFTFKDGEVIKVNT